MPPPPHTKPENVLKRAQELIGVGNQSDALHTLHEHVTSKRTRNSPIAALEPVMLLFIELCVDLRKGKMAKDGLYNYKNTSQNTNVATIELVFRKFIELAEQKVRDAQAKADEVSTAADAEHSIANVGDLEASETPESILLSTVSGEQSRDRTDRAIVTPWLKFLWETYRTVLDIFKNNARLEVMYQTTAHQAFQFCSRYARKTEFRRLCELLRNHLQNAAKYASQMHAINLSDPDTLQRHLDTRFEQLNAAVELELWQEAFKSVEDTHTLLSLSKRPAKSSMMANYFEKLTKIFMVSENYLFHAAAWSRYYNLLRQSAALVNAGQAQKKEHPTNITDADLTTSASFVVLSALAIPVISTTRSRGALIDLDEARKTRNTRLTTLLGMSQPPTRAILFKDALSKGLLHRARPEIRELYNILEVEFHPLSICKRISPILSQIGADTEMEKYVVPLQQVILTRLFQQLSQVYETVDMNFVLDLAKFPAPFELSRTTIEKFIMNGCKKGDLSIRIDHNTGVLTFDSDVFSSAKSAQPAPGANSSEIGQVQRLQSTPSEIIRSQLTRLSKALFITCQYVDPSFNADRHAAKQAALERAAVGAENEHRDALNRKEIIQKRKETAASALAVREQEEAKQKRIKAIKQQEAEVQRLADEQKEREIRRIRTEQQRVQREEMAKQIKDIQAGGIKGVDLDKLDLDELDSARIRQLKLQALEKEKNEIGEKLRVTAKRLDHLERAYRQEETKHLPEDYEKQLAADRAAYEQTKQETLEDAKARHASDLELKKRLSRLLSVYDSYKSDIQEQRKAEFARRATAAEKELNDKIEARKREYRDRRIRERHEREEQARLEAEQEERERVEAEQKERDEEDKRARLEREKAEREKSRLEGMAAAEKQRQREEEAIQRRRDMRGQGSVSEQPMPDRTTATPTASTSNAPRLALAGSKTGWRERTAQKEAENAAGGSTANGTPTTSETRPDNSTRKSSAYVPRQLQSETGDRRGSGPASTDKWQPRRSVAVDGDRSGSNSPAPGSSTGYGRASGFGRANNDERRESSSTAAPPSAGGAYKPGAFSRARKDGPTGA